MPDKALRRKSPLVGLFALGFMIVALTVATLLALPWRPDTLFVAQALLCGALVVLATRLAEACPEREALLVILAVALLLRAILLATPPFLSSDIYRYVWDGRVQAAGINPYRHIPAAPELQALRDLAIFPNVNRADFAVTIYPPAAQGLFFLVTRIAESVTGMKVALVAFEAVAVAAVLALLRRLGRPTTRVVAYAWHPLALWEVAGNGHVDAAMTALMMLGVWLYASGRTLAAGTAAALGALLKPFALLVLPAFWRPWDTRLPLVVLGVIVLAYAPFLSVGTGVLGFLPGYAGEEKLDSGSGFWLLAVLRWLAGAPILPTAAYLLACFAALAALALRAGFRRDRPLAVTVADINALLLAFLFLLSPDYPWYFLMLVPFVALTGSWPAWAMTVGAFVLYDPWLFDPGVRVQARDTVLYLAAAAALLAAAGRARRSRPVLHGASA
jgi:alpha-1,6-mannosyltransferase